MMSAKLFVVHGTSLSHILPVLFEKLISLIYTIYLILQKNKYIDKFPENSKEIDSHLEI